MGVLIVFLRVRREFLADHEPLSNARSDNVGRLSSHQPLQREVEGFRKRERPLHLGVNHRALGDHEAIDHEALVQHLGQLAAQLGDRLQVSRLGILGYGISRIALRAFGCCQAGKAAG